MISVFANGSVALGDYRHGRSDVDLTVVTDPDLPEAALRELAEALAHPALRCPAAGLELVVYDSGFAARASDQAGYRLNLNTGPLLPARADLDPSRSPSFWFVIDRAIAYQSGHLLYGTPVRQVLAPPTRQDVVAAIHASVLEHAYGAGHLADNQVLNGCRSVMFCRTGNWLAKRNAAHVLATSEKRFKPLIEHALQSFERPRGAALTLPAEDIRTFLTWVRERVEETVR
nr:nucleotidyltransferase domain-containing protein [Nocardia transvalensis]